MMEINFFFLKATHLLKSQIVVTICYLDLMEKKMDYVTSRKCVGGYLGSSRVKDLSGHK